MEARSKPRLRVVSVTSAHEDVVLLPPKGVTCVVGANNAGKSQLLRDLQEGAKTLDARKSVVLRSIEWNFELGNREESEQLLKTRALPGRTPDGLRYYQVSPEGHQVSDIEGFHDELTSTRDHTGGPQHLSGLFIRRVPAGSLHRHAAGVLRTEHSEDRQYNWLLERAYSEGDLANEVQGLLRRLFGVEVFLDHANHPAAMRVGVPDVEVPPINAPTTEYARAVEELPRLDNQGDGLRSIAGLALLLYGLAPDVLMLDEPEAFLHPGQARAVGRWLSQVADSLGNQIIVATHDRDLLSGILEESEASEVQLVRISRDDSGSRFTTITNEQRQKYWLDPVLRHSNVLQGLFHQRVVICEAYDDCGFYSAALSEMAGCANVQHVMDDTLFLPSLGKAGMASLAEVLREMDVDVRAIVDFDFLNDDKTIESLVRALGGDWDQGSLLYADVEKHIKGVDGFWAQAKKRGIAQVPAGAATTAFKKLLAWLRERRIHVVPNGELESFYKELGKGPDWLRGALAARAHSSGDATKFMGEAVPEVLPQSGNATSLEAGTARRSVLG